MLIVGQHCELRDLGITNLILCQCGVLFKFYKSLNILISSPIRNRTRTIICNS